MNAKKILGAAPVAATALTAVAPMASAATLNVTPAAYAEGFVTAIDTNARTITMGQVTYTVRSPAELIDLHAGIEVDIAYVMEGGKRVILAVTQLEDAEGGLVD